MHEIVSLNLDRCCLWTSVYISRCSSVATGANESGENACAIGTLPDLAMSTPAYDPTLVDWRSAQMAIEFVANKEKRFCNFAIRAHFHDAGSLGTAPSNPKVPHHYHHIVMTADTDVLPFEGLVNFEGFVLLRICKTQCIVDGQAQYVCTWRKTPGR